MIAGTSIRAISLSAAAALLAPGVAAAAAPPVAGPELALQALPPEPARPLVADSFCWVAGVDRSAKGVAVHFSGRRQVNVQTPDGRMEHRIYDPALLPDWGMRKADPAATAENERRAYFAVEGPVLHLEEGAAFHMHNSPSDRCSGKVMRDAQGRMGVTMTASVRIDWATPGPFTDSSERFIPAQPTDAVVREDATMGYGLYIEWPRQADDIDALRQVFEELAETSERKLKELAHREAALTKSPEPVSVTAITRIAGDDGRLLSLLTEGYFHFGGAHPVPGRAALLWDRKSGAEISMTDLFAKAMADLRAPYCAALDAERAKRSDWVPGSEEKYLGLYECPDFDLLAVAPIGDPGQKFDRIRIIASPYVAGPYSDGDYVVTFPVTAEVIALIDSGYRSAFQPYAARR